MVENCSNDIKCIICNKYYKDKSGLWYHNKKFHTKNVRQESPNHANNSLDIAKIPPTKSMELEKNNLVCKYCNYSFTRKDSLSKHYNRCKIKKEEETNKDNIINNLNNKITELQQQMNNFINTFNKIHPKTLQKINKNLVTGNNNSNNNNTINNIQIVKFGSEDIKSILSDKEIKKILNCKYKAIEESIKTVHFNDDRPEYRNIYITNLRDNIAYVYNGNKFEAVQKHSVINQLIDQHMNNIEVSYDDYKNKLPEKTVIILDKLIEKIQDEHTIMIDEENNKEFKNYKLFKMNEVKLMIYNETGNNTEVIKLKYNNSMLNKNKDIEV